MRITEVKFTRRYNIGNYEHEEYSLAAVLDSDSDEISSVEALDQLKADIEAAKAGESGSGGSKETPDAEEKPAKSGKSKEKKTKKEESNSEESSEDETGDEDTEEDSSDADTESEEDDRGSKISAAKIEKEIAKEKKGKKKSKAQAYDRNNEAHKELFTGVLDATTQGWKKTPESKEKAKKVSMKMVGKDFLDDSGDVLEDFTSEVKKLMGKK